MVNLSDFKTSTLTENFYDLGTVASGGTATLNLVNGSYQRVTVGGDLTVAFDNIPTSGTGWSMVLEMIDGAGSSITWPAALVTPGGTAIESTTSGTDLLFFCGHKGTTEYIGCPSGADLQ